MPRCSLCLALAACQPTGPADLGFPAPDAWGPTTGPGAPRVSFTAEELFQPCAWLLGGPQDVEHHNLAVMVDGLMLLPWAPEDGGGGITLFDVADPCAPVKVGEAYSPLMRESHTIGLSLGERRYAAVDYLEPDGSGGVGIWDITDPAAPRWASQVKVPGHTYPDSYTRLTLSVTWQGDFIYAATTGLGVFIIDAHDPLAPEVVGEIRFDGPHIVGQFLVFGNRAMASSAGLSRTVLMDVSDLLAPAVVPGGDFATTDVDGVTKRPYYFSNLGARWGLFARSKDGGGPMVYDISDPTIPTLVSQVRTDLGDGGYIFQHEDHLFVGDSAFGTVYDFRDPSTPTPIGTFNLRGDLDTVTPIGQVAIVSVDEKGDPGQASAVIPWSAEPDARGPTPGMTSPAASERFVATTGRVGVVFDEMIEPISAFPGSFRVWTDAGEVVTGKFNVAENVVNFTPDAPLSPNTAYNVHLPAGGIADISGNPMTEALSFRFSTGGSL